MKRLLYIPAVIVVCCLLFTACKKKRQPTIDFIPGRLLVGIKDGVPIESVFSFADSEGLYLLTVQYYTYASPYPKDSLASLSAYLLNTKSYLNKSVFDTIYEGDTIGAVGMESVTWDTTHHRIVVGCFSMTNLDIPSQADWIATKQRLGLTDITVGGEMLYVKVPPGQEQAMINKIQNNPIVTYASVNQIYRGPLF